MAATRLLMRRLREVLRLKYDVGLTHRAIAQACTVGLGTVTMYLQRAMAANDLAAQLGVPVIWDQEGPAGGNGDRVWRTARQVWQAYDPAAEWHVLVQDDALPCRDFLPGLARALDHVSQHALVSPYLGKGRNVTLRWGNMADRADREGASWVRSLKLMWGVCLAAPIELIPEMIAWCDRKAGMPDDMRVGRWFERAGLEVWYTWPSLVNHATVPSLTKHRAADRVARRVHQGSALDLDWSGPSVFDPMTMRARGPRSAPRGTWRGELRPVP